MPGKLSIVYMATMPGGVMSGKLPLTSVEGTNLPESKPWCLFAAVYYFTFLQPEYTCSFAIHSPHAPVHTRTLQRPHISWKSSQVIVSQWHNLDATFAFGVPNHSVAFTGIRSPFVISIFYFQVVLTLPSWKDTKISQMQPVSNPFPFNTTNCTLSHNRW